MKVTVVFSNHNYAIDGKALSVTTRVLSGGFTVLEVLDEGKVVAAFSLPLVEGYWVEGLEEAR